MKILEMIDQGTLVPKYKFSAFDDYTALLYPERFGVITSEGGDGVSSNVSSVINVSDFNSDVMVYAGSTVVFESREHFATENDMHLRLLSAQSIFGASLLWPFSIGKLGSDCDGFHPKPIVFAIHFNRQLTLNADSPIAAVSFGGISEVNSIQPSSLEDLVDKLTKGVIF